MTGTVAILRPPGEGIWYGARWSEVLQSLRAAIEAKGMRVEDRSWLDQPESLGGFDLVLPLLVWGYHLDGDWQAQVARWQSAGLPFCNPARVLAWNADKHYLRRLERAGVPVVPTLFAETLSAAVLRDALERFGCRRLVAKPTVSAGAYQTIRWSPKDPLEGGPAGPAMIQPYLDEIEESGEISLIFFEGRFSHAVRKVPRPGDFRVQPEFEGVLSLDEPGPDELAVAEAALRGAGQDLLYARVDLVREKGGRPLLMELELIEPDLFLGFDPGASARFGTAVAGAAGRLRSSHSQ